TAARATTSVQGRRGTTADDIPVRPRAGTVGAMAPGRAHGTLRAGEVGELVGVSGTTIGQWARRGYIRSSQREAEPRVYAVEDVAEAALVTALLQRGVRRPEIRRAVERLRAEGMPWPLATSRVATVRERRHTRLL